MPGPRLLEHCRAEIDADAVRGLQRRQKIADAATEVENAAAFRDEKAHIAVIVLIEVSVPLDPAVALGSHLLGKIAQPELARRWRYSLARADRSVHCVRLFIAVGSLGFTLVSHSAAACLLVD